MRRRRRPRTLLLVAVAVIAAGAGIGLRLGDVLRTQEQQTVDTRFSIRGREPAPRDVVVVAVDERTFADLGLRWPFPRRLHAQMIDRLHAAGARAIGFDVQFTERSDPLDDNAVIRAATRAPGLVLATTEVDAQGHTAVLGGEQALQRSGAQPANATVVADAGGVIRRAPLLIHRLGSFGWLLARAARPGLHAPPQDPTWIDFPGPPGTVKTFSYSSVLRGEVPASVFRGQVVVVGPTASSLQDLHPTSTSGSELMSGPEIQAAMADTFLRGGPLRTIPLGIELLICALLGALAPLCALWLKGMRGRLVPLAAGVGWAGATQLFFQAGWIVPFVAPECALALGLVGALGVDYASAAFERERVFDLFSRFVPQSVVNEVVARADGARLGGDARTCTVMFSDLRGFTSFSETLAPWRVIDVVNRYLGEMSEAILDAGGTLVAYMGDGIFAVFGAPLEQPDHADRALAAAREMVGPRLARFNGLLRELGLDADFRMGVGLNTGTVISGNVGSERRLEYAAIGDATNVAARVEGMTKGTPHMLLLTEETRDALTQPPGDLIFFQEEMVRGRQAPIRLWTVPDPPP